MKRKRVRTGRSEERDIGYVFILRQGSCFDQEVIYFRKMEKENQKELQAIKKDLLKGLVFSVLLLGLVLVLRLFFLSRGWL